MKRLFIVLTMCISFALSYTADAKKHDCIYCAHGCCAEGFLNGDGTADFLMYCSFEDDPGGGWGAWYIGYPAGSCGT